MDTCGVGVVLFLPQEAISKPGQLELTTDPSDGRPYCLAWANKEPVWRKLTSLEVLVESNLKEHPFMDD